MLVEVIEPFYKLYNTSAVQFNSKEWGYIPVHGQRLPLPR